MKNNLLEEMLEQKGILTTGRNWEVPEFLSPRTLALIHRGWWWPAGLRLQRPSRKAGGQPSCKITREKEFAAQI